MQVGFRGGGFLCFFFFAMRGRIRFSRCRCADAWDKKTYHPMYLFRVNMAAIGIVDDSVEENSGLSPDLAAGGSW